IQSKGIVAICIRSNEVLNKQYYFLLLKISFNLKILISMYYYVSANLR
ncbi:hypothetical protein Gotur_001706, partial [Gossypium turneri]